MLLEHLLKVSFTEYLDMFRHVEYLDRMTLREVRRLYQFGDIY